MEPYRITVLLDSIEKIGDILGSSLRFSAQLNARVEVLYLKSPLDVVKQENQLSAKRDLYEDARRARKRLKGHVSAMQLETPVSTKVTYGNVKDSLQQYIEDQKPDLVVSSKEWFKLNGNPSHPIPWLILQGPSDFPNEEALNLGIYQDVSFQNHETGIVKRILEQAKTPLLYFKIRKKNESKTENKANDSTEYVFTEGSNALESIAKYTERLKLGLLCVARQGRSGNWFETDPTTQLLRKTKVPVLLFNA